MHKRVAAFQEIEVIFLFFVFFLFLFFCFVFFVFCFFFFLFFILAHFMSHSTEKQSFKNKIKTSSIFFLIYLTELVKHKTKKNRERKRKKKKKQKKLGSLLRQIETIYCQIKNQQYHVMSN